MDNGRGTREQLQPLVAAHNVCTLVSRRSSVNGFFKTAVDRLGGRGMLSTVPLADTIESFRMICDGEVDHIAEQAFFNVGGMDMVMENWARIQKEG